MKFKEKRKEGVKRENKFKYIAKEKRRKECRKS